MSHNPIEVKEGAFVISDAHYSPLRPQLLQLIKDIHSKKLEPTQLILMGDIFDALFGSIKQTYKMNAEMIHLINDISKRIEIIYLEGNHDFNLQKVFPLVKVFTISNQPVLCTYKSQKLYLAHGDFDGILSYKLYTAFIRNRIILPVLQFIDNIFNNAILKNIDQHLDKKDDCKEFVGFKDFITKRLEDRFDCDYFIEGHFHQNVAFNVANFYYINLGAFACNQRYFIVESLQDKELLKEKRLF